MKKILDMFRLRKEERWPAFGVLLLMIFLNCLVINTYFGQFVPLSEDYWKLFINGFKLSGFDPITYYVVSDWDTNYNVYRHPLLPFFWYPAFLLNKALMAILGINCAVFIIAATQVLVGLYSFVFLYRTLREVIGLKKTDACLLIALFFSFAYVMLALCAPDHFSISMLLLIITLYLSGRKIKSGNSWKAWQTVVMFVLTAGVSLNNGVKTFLSAWFVNGRRLFRWRFFLLAIILPSALMWGFCRLEYRVFVWPKEMAKKHQRAVRDSIAKAKIYQTVADTISIKDSALIAAGVKAEVKKRAMEKFKRDNAGKPTPLMEGEFMRWTDISTSRMATITENLFGEAIQLHQDHLLEDTLRKRPVIVNYRYAHNYVASALLGLLFLCGIWCGRKSRLMLLSLSFFAFDMFIHLLLGFGINEIYIMSPHWAFVFPITIAFLLYNQKGRKQKVLRVLIALLTLFFFIHNLSLLTQGLL
ncbi:MAG: DUF6080 domain-containing protein [Prevotella sp.]|nr:DUF6080 domain-containing protein [Prevotella sp.]